MIDKYVYLHVLDYLKSCDKCGKFDIYDSTRSCCYCSKYNCNKCKMIRDYTLYEVTGLYCSNCHKKIFNI